MHKGAIATNRPAMCAVHYEQLGRALPMVPARAGPVIAEEGVAPFRPTVEIASILPRADSNSAVGAHDGECQLSAAFGPSGDAATPMASPANPAALIARAAKLDRRPGS